MLVYYEAAIAVTHCTLYKCNIMTLQINRYNSLPMRVLAWLTLARVTH